MISMGLSLCDDDIGPYMMVDLAAPFDVAMVHMMAYGMTHVLDMVVVVVDKTDTLNIVVVVFYNTPHGVDDMVA